MRAGLKLLIAVAVLLMLPAGAAANDRRGAALYAANCAKCHGLNGQGIHEHGPPLRNAGARAADFYLRTGYMPLANPHDQPTRTRVIFTERELRALVGYVASLGHGPPIPTPRRGSISAGQRLFTEHCAGCHQALAQGGYVTGARVPPLTDATDRQIAEAVRIGPYLMTKFSRRDISDRELDSLVRYVLSTRHPDDRGGWGIAHIGPIPEGALTWLVVLTVMVGMCVLLGRRASG